MTKPISRKMAVDALLYRFGLEWHVIICTVCNTVLTPGDAIEFDHVHADVHGGPHEYQNLRPLHKACHKTKTRADVKANAKVKRIKRGKKKSIRCFPKSKPFPPKGSVKFPARKKRI